MNALCGALLIIIFKKCLFTAKTSHSAFVIWPGNFKFLGIRKRYSIKNGNKGDVDSSGLKKMNYLKKKEKYMPKYKK